MIKTKITEVFQEMGWPSAKPEQHQIVEAILNGDVFVILPTGYGKSACYQCLPLLHKKMYPSKAPIIVLVVSPLRALIKDQVKLYFSFYMGELFLSLKQVSALTKKGFEACCVLENDEIVNEGISNGDYQFVYFTPETLLLSKRWRAVLAGDVFSSRLQYFIVDEAHTVVQWQVA